VKRSSPQANERNPGEAEGVTVPRMAQSLAKIYIHLIFSTKNRERILTDDIGPDLHAYLGGILRDLNSPAIEINTEPDHLHALFIMSRTLSVSQIVQEIKTGTSSWLKKQSSRYANVRWQNWYGAFSVSQSGVADVRSYIRNQREHHRRMTFQEEFREFLRRYELEFDERYVWD
jgi:REP element-mobilizing transposase RayT